MRDTFWDNKLVFWDEGLPGIKHCPCCGGVPVLKDDGYETPEIDSNGAYVGMDIYEPSLFWVECKDCGLSTKEQKTEEEAIEKWNMRVGPESEVDR